ncbi:M67 family metallopeptidase [Sphingomonas sp. NBWT7]|uniref:M67 family metallopeptidase n=1 Tax=Sphingomonas sp. NBWT7 TaxID=2596913 RepID=UPI0016295E4B|nr:M67 family metallopeptidase [Sphingomonas sp. NBWT7]QNE31294.1 M67 family metallopeptidase [Sphingomonas sp. NBWT7]
MGIRLQISRSLRERIIAEATASLDEICGLLLGEGATVSDAVACANVHPTPATHFELDPTVLFHALRTARAGGPAVIGHYHSHPTGSTMPSTTDAAAAAADGAFWIIAADGGVAAWRAVRDGTVHGRFDPVALAIAR